MSILTFSFLLTMILLVFALNVKYFEKERNLKNRVDTYVQLRDPKDEIEDTKSKKDLISTLKQNSRKLTLKMRKYYNNIMPTTKEDEIQKKLLRAGSPFRMNVADYYIFNNIIRVAIPLLFGAIALILKANIFEVIAIILVGILLSFKALDVYLNYKGKERCKKALKELPDFLDILTISVEAGLGFDLALSKTIEKRNGILPLEFNTCLEEMRLGKTRRDSLLGIKERLPFDEMSSFVNSIVQAEKLGTGIVNTLRAKSEDERYNRMQRAEESAMKTTIKILFPLVILIFPAIFIIILGPAVVQIMKAF